MSEFRLIARTATYDGRPQQVQRIQYLYENPDGQRATAGHHHWIIHTDRGARKHLHSYSGLRPLPPPSTPTRPTHDTRDGVDDGS